MMRRTRQKENATNDDRTATRHGPAMTEARVESAAPSWQAARGQGLPRTNLLGG